LVPNDPGLAGLVLFAQWFVWDSGVPAGAATSRGSQVALF
jgi:hypothetical protein